MNQDDKEELKLEFEAMQELLIALHGLEPKSIERILRWYVDYSGIAV